MQLGGIWRPSTGEVRSEGKLTDAAVKNRWKLWLRGDRAGVLVILAVTMAAAMHLAYGGTLVGQDSATQFYPWYSELGQRLRNWDIPGWNSAQLSGAPFAADPQSGWTYLPAMLAFTLLPLSLAVEVFLVLHLLIAGLGAYWLCRALSMPVLGAAVAGVAYELTGPVYGRSACCPAQMEVAAWTPVALLGAELAVRSRSWLGRGAGWIVGGLALSQGLAAWLGQGSYYLLLTVGAYLVYRMLLTPGDDERLPRRLWVFAVNGIAVLAIGFGLAAAGILPRLEYIGRSNVAGGEYQESGAVASVIGGATPASVFDRLFEPNLHYPGIGVLALALAALCLAGGRFGVPYFAFLGIAGSILASPQTTPLHAVLYAVLPRFEELHRHWPERVSLVALLAPAMLAGAAVGVLPTYARRHRRLGLGLAVPVAAVLALKSIGAGVPPAALLVVGLVTVLGAAMVLAPRPLRAAVAPLLVVVVAADLLLATRAVANAAPYGGFHRVDLDEFYGSTGAVEFLRDRGEEQPARFFGYDVSLVGSSHGQPILYRYFFAEPETRSLIVNNRANIYGLEDVQGYNPVQPRRYIEFLTVLNGHPQEYHDANIFPGGIDSPLLDLLNARYIVVPNPIPPGRSDLGEVARRLETVYADEAVRILENRDALPRAWLVHEARQVAPGEALSVLAAGGIDPRRTVLLEELSPNLAQPTGPSGELVTIVRHEPDRIRLSVQASADAVLVLSEMYDPNWKAYVDGAEAPVLVADHLLRAVAVPAGQHTVELRYESETLRAGTAISGITGLAVLSSLLGMGWVSRRRRRGGRSLV